MDALAPFVNLSIAETNKELLGRHPELIGLLFEVVEDTKRVEEYMPRAKQQAAKVAGITSR